MRTMVKDRDKRILALLDSQRAVLERIAGGAPLSESLLTLVKLIERQAPDVRCAILLCEQKAGRLRFAAAPSIPEEFKAHIEPHLRIAEDMVNCGAAAFLRRPVYTEDTSTDPRWAHSRDLAQRVGLRAVWSTPILSDDNFVLGTFAMFYGRPKLPSKEHIQLIDMAVQLARVAIESDCDRELLRILFESAPGATAIVNLRGVIVGANTAFAGMLGYTPAELSGKRLLEISEDNDVLELVEGLLWSRGGNAAAARRYRGKNGEVISAHTNSRLRLDSDGTPRYVLLQVGLVSATEDRALEALSPREREVLAHVVSGLTSKEIASKLGLAVTSVDTYRSRAMAKLEVDNVVHLVRLAVRHGVLSP